MIRRLLCWLGLHSLIRVEDPGAFMSYVCEHCGRRSTRLRIPDRYV